MTKLDELLNELCPNGVPFKRLEECCSLEKGNTPIQKAIPGEYPLVVTTNERKSSNTFQFDQPSVCVPLVSSRGHGVACLNQVFYQEGRFALGNILCAVTPLRESGLSAEFLYYYLNLKKDSLIVPLMKGGANVSLTVNSLKKVRVAIPPLSVQEEIIKRLQAFEDLLDTLSAELSARRKQYEYYRNKLLSFNPQVTWKTLGDIGKVSMCKRIMKNETSSDGDVPFYKIGTFGKQADAYISWETFERYKAQYSYPNKGDILISAAGTIGRTVVFDGEPAYFQDSNIVWVDNDESQVLNEFLYYWYQTNPWKVSTGGTIARLYNDNISGAKVPVLPIDTQKRLVRALSNFDAVCNDLNIGLPAEIEARQKQYEYYRDLLLTFAETGSTLATDRQTDRLK